MACSDQHLHDLLQRHWGYTTLRPLQRDVIRAILAGQDSITILPTGGGKSLCYQIPALCLDGFAVVVSPLISLMKDQVDALTTCGVAAARLDSSQTPAEQDAALRQAENGRLRLLYLAPERLMQPGFLRWLQRQRVSFVAVDEAHCVSLWGHDFRPEYRTLGTLRRELPGLGIHALTATATPPVRDDIAVQLALQKPRVFAGSFDRPNLHYTVTRAEQILRQVCRVLDRHPQESGIIYCIRRKDVDTLCAQLQAKGYRAAPYHAGLDDAARKKHQDRFMKEAIDIVVATVAFGMGIDKSNVRYVIHTGMPKSLEHYQQESGRAGRDGLEAECWLLYGGNDYRTWQFLIDKSAADAAGSDPQEAVQIGIQKLNAMMNFCTGVTCRHAAILQYFGEAYEQPSCGACDVCLGGLDVHPDALVTAQKILSCVVRLQQRFGADYTANVLRGAREQRLLQNGHERISTYGLLAQESHRTVRDWIGQLVAQACLRAGGEYRVLEVTELGWQVLRGQQTPRLLKAALQGLTSPPPPAKPDGASPSTPHVRLKQKTRELAVGGDPWADADRALFEQLRALRRTIADERDVPAFVIFGDATLRDMARRKPKTPDQFLMCHGVGDRKCAQFGEAFLRVIGAHR